jgi:hypothetical protein
MNSVQRSSRLERWNHFLRWFFNSSPTALLEPVHAPTGSRAVESHRESRGVDLSRRASART